MVVIETERGVYSVVQLADPQPWQLDFMEKFLKDARAKEFI